MQSLLALLVLSLALSALLLAGASGNGSATCRWKVLSVRDPRPDDLPLEFRLPFARQGDEQREFPGPDSMRIVDRNDQEHHPRLFLQDLRTGTERPLLANWASWPGWSPDGRQVSCLAWKSRYLPRQLIIVDWRNGKKVEVDSSVVVSDYKWSPDSKALAVYGSNRRAGSSVLAVVDPATGRIKVIDKTSAFADFDYSWSPDGRSLAYTKPTRITDHDEVVEADLWISERSGRLSCRVLNTPNRVERRPLWVGARELSLLSAPVAGEQLGDLRTTVLLLSESPSNGRQKATCFP